MALAIIRSYVIRDSGTVQGRLCVLVGGGRPG
jgi:hypothetical protein